MNGDSTAGAFVDPPPQALTLTASTPSGSSRAHRGIQWRREITGIAEVGSIVDGIDNIIHQLISWLGYIVMFAFVAFVLLSSLYYIGVFLIRVLRRIFVRPG